MKQRGRCGRFRRGCLRSIPALVAIVSALALGGCLEEAADKNYNFNNPNDTTPSQSGAAGQIAIAFVGTSDEIVVIVNQSGSGIDMSGWSLRAQNTGDIYTFGTFTLLAGRFVRVHTGTDTDDANDLYWSGSDHWNSNIDTAELKDASGTNVAVCSFNSSSSLNC